MEVPEFLKRDVVHEYVRRKVQSLVGRSTMTLTVSVAGTWSSDKAFWKELAGKLSQLIKESDLSGRFEARPLKRVEGGIEFICTDEHGWKEYFRTTPDEGDPRVLNWAQIRPSGPGQLFSHKVGNGGGVVRFRAYENCPWYFMILLWYLFNGDAYDSLICGTEGFPEDDDFLWSGLYFYYPVKSIICKKRRRGTKEEVQVRGAKRTAKAKHNAA